MTTHLHEIDLGRRVYVYFNLHKKCWSVRQAGKVVMHANRLCLKDVRYLVAEGGRNKVLQSGVKNVHAGLSGYLVKTVPNIPEVSYDVTYNPFKYNSFVSVEKKRPIQHSDYAYLEAGQKYRNVEAIFDIDKVENCITI